jgi:hypothetical protein
MTTKRRTFTTIGAAALALVTGAVTASASAGAQPGPVVATYRLAPGGYTVQAGPDAMWAIDADEFHDAKLYRIDSASHAMKLVASLPFPAGSMTLGFGSEWVSDYYGNAVWRLAPNGRVQAEIGTGLQPEQMRAAFGSLWVSNHHGASLTRIDPTTDTVQATVQVGAPDTFRNGPQGVTDDGTRLFVGSSNLQALQSVDPATNTVTTPASLDDAFCGPLEAIAGFVWSVDHCTGTTYQLTPAGSVQQRIASTGVPSSVTTRAGELWIGDDTIVDPNTGQGSAAVLAERDPQTGALLRSVAIGGDAGELCSGFGDLWVYDSVANTIRRVHV